MDVFIPSFASINLYEFFQSLSSRRTIYKFSYKTGVLNEKRCKIKTMTTTTT